MKQKKAVKITTYLAGGFILVAALTIAAYMIMSALGMFYPRKIKLVFYTPDKTIVYNENAIVGDKPTITYGNLRLGDKLITSSIPAYSKVGEYKNAPQYMIIDKTGADVTSDYEVIEDFGNLIVSPRSISVYCRGVDHLYDGKTIRADQITLSNGSPRLLFGHSLISNVDLSLTEPGEIQIPSNYCIINANGEDVTDQYSVTEDIGKLIVYPRYVGIHTGSAEKVYDGKPLSSDYWFTDMDSMLMPGHRVVGKCITSETQVGMYHNEAEIKILDEQDNIVNRFYNITFVYGQIIIDPIKIHITTPSAEKEYDGSALTMPLWTLSSGTLLDGHKISLQSAAVLDKLGSIQNDHVFTVTDANGNDVTSIYFISTSPGLLSMTSRNLHIRTGTASKVYDGIPLVCEEYEIVTGSLCEGEVLDLSFASLDTLGMSDNYIVNCTIYAKNEDGSLRDVTRFYHITYDYGTLTVYYHE